MCVVRRKNSFAPTIEPLSWKYFYDLKYICSAHLDEVSKEMRLRENEMTP